MLENFVENLLLWERALAGAGEDCEEEGATETTCDELTTMPSPCTTGGGGKVKN